MFYYHLFWLMWLVATVGFISNLTKAFLQLFTRNLSCQCKIGNYSCCTACRNTKRCNNKLFNTACRYEKMQQPHVSKSCRQPTKPTLQKKRKNFLNHIRDAPIVKVIPKRNMSCPSLSFHASPTLSKSMGMSHHS